MRGFWRTPLLHASPVLGCLSPQAAFPAFEIPWHRHCVNSPNPTLATNSDNITNNPRCALEVPAKSPLVLLDDDDVKSIVCL